MKEEDKRTWNLDIFYKTPFKVMIEICNISPRTRCCKRIRYKHKKYDMPLYIADQFKCKTLKELILVHLKRSMDPEDNKTYLVDKKTFFEYFESID